jgi:hypothetical protein
MITVARALSRSNIPPNSEMMKTIGRRVAKSFKAQYPAYLIERKGEGIHDVNHYPDTFRGKIIKIAEKYMRQHDKKLIFERRKRKIVNNFEIQK